MNITHILATFSPNMLPAAVVTDVRFIAVTLDEARTLVEKPRKPISYTIRPVEYARAIIDILRIKEDARYRAGNVVLKPGSQVLMGTSNNVLIPRNKVLSESELNMLAARMVWYTVEVLKS